MYELWDEAIEPRAWIGSFATQRVALAHAYARLEQDGPSTVEGWSLIRRTADGQMRTVADGEQLVQLARLLHNLGRHLA